MMEAEYIIRNMIQDIDKMRNDYERICSYSAAMKLTAPALALWAYDYTNERHEDFLEGWEAFVNHVNEEGAFMPKHGLRLDGGGHTKMIAEVRSPIWQQLGFKKDGEPFAFAGLLSYRLGIQTIGMEDYRKTCKRNGRGDPYESLCEWARM